MLCDRLLQIGHQVPRFTLAGLAVHRCPLPHCHSRGVFALKYFFDRHLPPRASASCLISSRVSGFVPAQAGHHDPFLMFAGWASQMCPRAHCHFSFVFALR